MRVLVPLVHGILDYSAGLLLMALPNLGGFTEVGGPAAVVPRALGVAVILYSMLTSYDLAALRVLPLRAHLALDAIASLLLACSPFVFGFWRLGPRFWIPHVAAAIVIAGAAVMTESDGRRVRARF
jgi:hypothetical protein